MRGEEGQERARLERIENGVSRSHTISGTTLDLKENQVLMGLRSVTGTCHTFDVNSMGSELGLALDYFSACEMLKEKFQKLDYEGKKKALFIIGNMMKSGQFPVEISALTQYLYGYSFVLSSES